MELWLLELCVPLKGRADDEDAYGNGCCLHPDPDRWNAGSCAARCLGWRRRRHHWWCHRRWRPGVSVLLRTRSRLRRRRLLRRWLRLAEAALLGRLRLARPSRPRLWLRRIRPDRLSRFRRGRFTTDAPFISRPEKDRFFSSQLRARLPWIDHLRAS